MMSPLMERTLPESEAMTPMPDWIVTPTPELIMTPTPDAWYVPEADAETT